MTSVDLAHHIVRFRQFEMKTLADLVTNRACDDDNYLRFNIGLDLNEVKILKHIRAKARNALEAEAAKPRVTIPKTPPPLLPFSLSFF